MFKNLSNISSRAEAQELAFKLLKSGWIKNLHGDQTQFVDDKQTFYKFDRLKFKDLSKTELP